MEPEPPDERPVDTNFAPRNWTKARVFLTRRGDGEVVVKTVAGASLLARLCFARLLLRREGRVLARLGGIPGIPRLIEADENTLVLERLPGRTLFELRKVGVSEATAESLERLVARLHERGFAHGDIGRRDVLVASDGSARLVDFATAIGPGMPPILWRILLPFLRRRDRYRVRTLVRRYRAQWDFNAERRAARRNRREAVR
jgi:RIO-like serine/threonine protein kinase